VAIEGSDSDRDAAVRTMAAAIPTRFAQRERGSRGLFTDADLWVAPETWARVVDLVTEASRLLHAQALPPRTAGTLRANLSVAAFRLAHGAEEEDR
jgi:hypothetical protein